MDMENEKKGMRKVYAPAIFMAAVLGLASQAAISSAASSAETSEDYREKAGDSAPYPAAYLNFGTRFGESELEGFSDMIFPLFSNERNSVFINPRVSLLDEGANEVNLGLGLRHMLSDGLVIGGNIFVDSRESKYDNRFNQWGAGIEFLSEYVDFRANVYDADNDKELIGRYSDKSVETRTRTTTTRSTSSRVRADAYHVDPSSVNVVGNRVNYLVDHEQLVDYITKTKYTTSTTTITTTRLFESYEASMDGWDTELGFKLPWSAGPEIRLFGGYYDYHNPVGDNVEGLKARLEVKTGPYLSFDAEAFEDGSLNGSDWLVGARVAIPLTRDLTLHDFVAGLVSMRHRTLDERMRGEMVMRDVRIQTQATGFKENVQKRQVATETAVKTKIKTVSGTKTTHEKEPGKLENVPDNQMLFVDWDNRDTMGNDPKAQQNGTIEHPYQTIQMGMDAAAASGSKYNTVFVFERNGRVSTPTVAGTGKYENEDGQVRIAPGKTLTSALTDSKTGEIVYQTKGLPVISVDSSSGGTSAVSMAENTALSRMAVEARGVHAVSIGPVSSGTVNVEKSRISTSGGQFHGVYTHLDNGAALSRITLANNTITTEGESSFGVHTNLGGSARLETLVLTGNEINTLGGQVAGANDGADGVYTMLNGDSKLGTLVLSGNLINTEKEGAVGMDLGVNDNAAVDALVLRGNTINTQGNDTPGVNMYLGGSGAPLTHITLAGNTIKAQAGYGIHINFAGLGHLGAGKPIMTGNNIESGAGLADISVDGHSINTAAGGYDLGQSQFAEELRGENTLSKPAPQDISVTP